jgi:hypothetical protein
MQDESAKVLADGKEKMGAPVVSPPQDADEPTSTGLLSRNVKVKIYKIIILPAVLYGCESWSLTLRKEHRQRV